MLCEQCRQYEANCHLTIIGERGVVINRNLCGACYEAGVPEAKWQQAEAPREENCYYCRGQACAGGTDIFAPVTGELKQKFMCAPCLAEYGRYIEQQLKPAHTELPRQKQLTLLRALNVATEKHMQRWVSEKGSR